MKKVLKTILNTIINILIVVVLIVSVVVAIFALTSKADGVSTIFGYTVQIIESDSMNGGSPDGYEGGNYSTGDVIIGKRVGFDSSIEYQKGDIITYMGFLDGSEEFGKQAICHRIVDVYNGADGVIKYQTQGDNRSVSYVPDQETVDEYITSYDIVSYNYTKDYHGTVIHGIGKFLSFIQTQLGFFLVVLLPMIIFFMYELIRVIFNVANYKNEKKKELEDGEKKQQDLDQQAAIDAAVAEALKKRDEQAASVEPEPEPEKPDSSADFPRMTADEYEEFKKFQEFKKMQDKED